MIVNRGCYKLVLESTACRTPPSNSLVEVESSRCKTTLLTVSCGLSTHVAKTGWYYDLFLHTLTLGLSSLFSFWLKILLTLTLGSRDYFLPESPSLQMIDCFTRRFKDYP